MGGCGVEDIRRRGPEGDFKTVATQLVHSPSCARVELGLVTISSKLNRSAPPLLAHLSCECCQLAVQVRPLEDRPHLVADWQRQCAHTHTPCTIRGGVQQRTLEVHLWGQPQHNNTIATAPNTFVSTLA